MKEVAISKYQLRTLAQLAKEIKKIGTWRGKAIELSADIGE